MHKSIKILSLTLQEPFIPIAQYLKLFMKPKNFELDIT